MVNASPLIILAKAGYLDLLRIAGDPVLVPLPVQQEIQQAGATDPAVLALGKVSWLQVVDPGPTALEVLPFGLDVGEEAVLTWALAHPGTEALVDDSTARRCAQKLAIPHRGCLGLVLNARRLGLLPAARPVLEALRTSGLYLSDRVLNSVLPQVGE